MDGSSGEKTYDGNPLEEAIISALVDYRALSTNEIVSIVGAEEKRVRQQLDLMANIGQIERRKTKNQDVWLTWKN